MNEKKLKTFERFCADGNVKRVCEMLRKTKHFRQNPKRETIIQEDTCARHGFITACQHGCTSVVKFILENYRSILDIDYGVHCACVNGNVDVVQYLVESSRVDLDAGMTTASLWGHIDVVQLLLKKGATNYNECLEAACRRGYVDIANLMLDNTLRISRGFLLACHAGHAAVVSLLLDRASSCVDANRGFVLACTQQHVDVALELVSRGYTPPATVHPDVIEQLLWRGVPRVMFPDTRITRDVFADFDNMKNAIVIPELPSVLEELIRSYFP